MIKQFRKIKLIKNFKMENTTPITIPSIIKEKDVYSMFSGLLTLIKEMSISETKKLQMHKDNSYNNLLKMYTRAVKEMNKYKSLYLNSLKIAK